MGYRTHGPLRLLVSLELAIPVCGLSSVGGNQIAYQLEDTLHNPECHVFRPLRTRSRALHGEHRPLINKRPPSRSLYAIFADELVSRFTTKNGCSISYRQNYENTS